MKISLDLYQFAFFPGGWDDFRDLAALAYPESWRFKSPLKKGDGLDVEILVKYIQHQHYRNAVEFNEADSQEARDYRIFIGDGYAYFHTNLYTADYKAIYAYFERQTRRNVVQDWIFSSYILEDDPWLNSFNVRPEPYIIYPDEHAQAFYPDWPVKSRLSQISRQEMILQCLPEKMRGQALQSNMDRAIRQSLSLARTVPNFAAPIENREKIAFALPLYLTGCVEPDVSLILLPYDTRTYVTCRLASLQHTYLDARYVGPVYATWLNDLVVQPPFEALLLDPSVSPIYSTVSGS